MRRFYDIDSISGRAGLGSQTGSKGGHSRIASYHVQPVAGSITVIGNAPKCWVFNVISRETPCVCTASRIAKTRVGAPKGVSVQRKAFRCSENRIRCKGVGGGLHRTESGALFTAFGNALSSLGRRTYTNLWAPGWVPSSQDEQLQGFEEKSQEPIAMGSWLRSWPPSRRFSRRFETRSGRSGVSPSRKPGRFSWHFETR